MNMSRAAGATGPHGDAALDHRIDDTLHATRGSTPRASLLASAPTTLDILHVASLGYEHGTVAYGGRGEWALTCRSVVLFFCICSSRYDG